jgi:hypothetical protein
MPETLKAYDCHILIKQKFEVTEDSVETGTYYEHQKAKITKHKNIGMQRYPQ